MQAYITLKKEADDFFIEKKSRFIGYAKPVSTEEEALEFIDKIKKLNREASHNVSAYILREGGLKRFSDDGEPQGKAGIPVLDAMEKNKIVDAVIVATRYFGGTMLGGGGLIRAYSHTASIAIAAAEKILMKECSLMELSCDYNQYGKVGSVIPENGGIIDDTEFLENVNLKFHISPEDIKPLEKALADATNGQVSVVETGKKFYEFSIEEE